MTSDQDQDQERTKDLYAEYVALVESGQAVDFGSWAAGHPEHERGLRELHAAWSRASRTLGDEEEGYEVLAEIGAGGWGRVFRAFDRVLRRHVALKVLNDDVASESMRRRFLEEARVLARLDHPNIVRIHSVDSVDGAIRLSLELIEGRTLQQVVQNDGPLSPEEAAHVGVELCRALAAIHAEGLIHMDVKPGNVMRADGGRIVLLDFGFARSKAPTGERDKTVGGTPPFMSPEHFEGGKDIDPRSDVFSLGSLLYWCVTGEYPFEFDDLGQLHDRVLAGQMIPLLDRRPNVPAAFVRILERALARAPGDRYASAGEMERELAAFLGNGAIAKAPPHALPAPPASPPSRRRALAALSAVAVVVFAALAGSGLLAADPPRIESTFYVQRDDEAVPLSDDFDVDVGDRLFLQVRGDEPFFLYVFNQDEENRWFQLAPENEPTLLEPDVEHRLPGDDPNDDFWVVNTVGGTEHLFVLASPTRVPFAEALLETIPEPSPVSPTRMVDPMALSHRSEEVLWRGVGGRVGDGTGKDEPLRLEALFDAFEAKLAPKDRVHVSRLRLTND